MKLISVLLVVLCSCLVGGTLPALGTQVQYKSVEQLGEDSSAVVRGTVANVRSFWNEKHTKIFTATLIAVDESYKGRPGGTVEVLQLGGTVDNVQVTAHGALHWTAGEEVVLFLEPYTEGRYQVSGFSQGKFKIERDPDTGAAYIKRPALEGAQMVGAPGAVDASAELETVSLEKFLKEALGDRERDIRE
jgi:hypothetical protein